MSRPRKAPEPDTYAPCARCHLAYVPVAVWPDGTICGYCYMAAKRTRGTCSGCSHEGVLPGVCSTGPLCRHCSGITLNVDCRRCGAEDELHSGGRCWACALEDQVRHTLAGPDGSIPTKLVPLAEALISMGRPNSGMVWIRKKHVSALLRSIASGGIDLTHEALDVLPYSGTSEYIRGLLVEHGILPPRDIYLAKFLTWSAAKLTTVTDPAHRSVANRFIRWHQLKRLRKEAVAKGLVSRGLFLSVKQSTTVALKFLNDLTEQGRDLADVDQRIVDRWYASGPSTNALAELFLYWAMTHKHIRKVDLPRRKAANSPAFGHGQRIAAIRMILTEDKLSPALRIAAGLVLLYGQPLNRIASLTTDRIRISDARVELCFTSEWLPVTEPFASLLRTWTIHRSNLQTAAHNADSRWLFPSTTPGQHLAAALISKRLKAQGIPAQLGRTAAWRHMVRDAPPSVLAELLGVSPATAMHHADLAGANFTRYAALRQEVPQTGHP